MKNSARVTLSTFGALAGLVGIEHGIGEILQGSKPPDGILILSWPDSPFFAILSGEPAMTIVPNLLAAGILSVIFSLVAVVWSIGFIQRKSGGLVLLLLSLIMLLVGGGFGPPLLGSIVSAAALRMNAAPTPVNPGRTPTGFQRFLAQSWPWIYSLALVAWLCVFPGANILAYYFSIDSASLVLLFIACAMGGLLLSIWAGFARDRVLYKKAPRLSPTRG